VLCDRVRTARDHRRLGPTAGSMMETRSFEVHHRVAMNPSWSTNLHAWPVILEAKKRKKKACEARRAYRPAPKTHGEGDK